MYCSKCNYSEFSNGIPTCHYMGEEMFAPCQIIDADDAETLDYGQEDFLSSLSPEEEIEWDDKDLPF